MGDVINKCILFQLALKRYKLRKKIGNCYVSKCIHVFYYKSLNVDKQKWIQCLNNFIGQLSRILQNYFTILLSS